MNDNAKWFSPHDPKRRIGSLIDVSATEAKINLTKAGSGEQSWLMGSRVSVGEVNEFVFIECGEYTILARVVKVWLESGERLSVDQLDDQLPENNPIGLVQLLVSLDVQNGKNYRGIKQYPRLGVQVYAAHPQLVALIAEGSLHLEGKLQLPIASMPHDETVTVSVTPENLFARHCAILGSTGGGKSYTMATLLENVERLGGKALLIDATGEYKNLPCDSYYVGNNNVSRDKQTTYPHWLFTDSDIRALLRPAGQTQAPKLDAAIKSLKVIIHQGRSDILVKANQEKELIERDLLAVESQELQGKVCKWSFKLLGEQIEEECVWPSADYGKDITKWGDKHIGEFGHCLSLISRIEAMASNKHLDWMLDCDDELTMIPNLLEDFLSENDQSILRLDLSAVPFEAHARELLVNAIGRKLLTLAREGNISHDKPLLVFIDEAHQFLNKTIGEEHNAFNLDAFGNIAKEGRKYGLNVVIATQRPRDIPEDVLSQIGTLIVHRLTNERDQEVVKRSVGAIDYRSASFLPALGQGEALLLGVDFPFPMTVQIKMPNIKPESCSAIFSGVWGRI
ncbi:MAG: ATP-binding protein [Xanthomonadaceae bacterium]|nr:ATP-binding protein [Xanthomonadaceae bacterium]